MNSENIKLDQSWKPTLINEFQKPYMAKLKAFLQNEIKNKKLLYPKGTEYFSALNMTPFEKVKVVIIGQDPYHGAGQAHGLCFSVQKGVPIPPSLQNILKELKDDLGFDTPKSGNLDKWAKQGVLLLNAVLTVEAGKAGSHQGRGWENFTDKIIEELNSKRDHVVFMLWGSYAQKKANMVDKKRHLVLSAPHPSPLSAYRGFFGTKPFSKANNYLIKNGLTPIDWNLNL